MYRICLIDDEPWVLIGLEYLVDWTFLGFEIAGRYEHARQAWEEIRTNPPDAVISDIRMPGISGLELLGQIRKENLPVEVVLVSAFADFSYAQEAIAQGAFQYLLKPVQKEELEKCLVKLRECLDAKEKSQAVKDNADRRGRLMQAENVGQAVSGLLGDASKGKKQVFLADCYASGDPPEYFLEGTCYTVIHLDGEELLLFGTTDQEGEELFQKLMVEAERWPSFRFGLVCTGDTDMKGIRLFQKAKIAQASAEFLGVRGFIRRPFPEEKKRQEDLLKSAAYDETEIMTKQLKQLEEDVRAMRLPLDRLFQLMVRMRDVSGKPVLSHDAHAYTDAVNEYPDCDALFAALGEMFSEGNEKAQFTEVMKEIREHYASPRTLAAMAQELGMSQAALSQLIKRKTEKTYSELISMRKLEKACELLTYSGETIVHIAELTGYSDQFYFSKQFKRAFGESPNAYRKRTQKR